jgi:hypothetical protein
MLADELKLHWAFIDMRPRWRRRVAVVITYSALLIVSVLTSQCTAHPVWAMVALAIAVEIVVLLSVMRRNGIVKQFEPAPAPLNIKGIGEVIFVDGLDEWARYFYGVPKFDVATPSQQSDLLSRYRVGRRLFPAKYRDSDTPWLDEREVRERDSAERWAAKQGIAILSAFVGIYTLQAWHQRLMDPLEVATAFLISGVALQTLPRARVLWTEIDPRELSRELALVE